MNIYTITAQPNNFEFEVLAEEETQAINFVIEYNKDAVFDFDENTLEVVSVESAEPQILTKKFSIL